VILGGFISSALLFVSHHRESPFSTIRHRIRGQTALSVAVKAGIEDVA